MTRLKGFCFGVLRLFSFTVSIMALPARARGHPCGRLAYVEPARLGIELGRRRFAKEFDQLLG